MKQLRLAVVLASSMAMPAPASNDVWQSVKTQLYGDRYLLNGDDVISIDAPYRTPDDARADLAAQIVAPDGAKLAKITVVLDENPMPVSAVFDLETPQPSFFFDITMRVNGPTPMHVIVETSDGRLFVSETFVKTSGTGACAAPPGTDPELALASLGEISIEMAGIAPGVGSSKIKNFASRLGRMDVDISHPSHSGMQMDQISLLFIPLRYVENIEINLDGAGFVDVTGSISLSENPRLGLAVPQSTRSVDVTMTDTDGTVAHVHKDLPGY
ncbi:MAG: quinoprotein dehydrogenase-associated SoxYZ-like carrier [Paracoccaceae bacterium]